MPELHAYQRDGVHFLHACTAAHGAALLADDMGVGKAQPLDARVLTPGGWTLMGAIKRGDFVIGADGCPKRVLGVFPQGDRPIYRVTFSDGAVTECDDEHLWTVTTPVRKKRGAAWLTKPLREIRARLRQGPNSKWFVPVVAPVQAPDAALPLDPYVLGVLLGDGGLTLPRCVRFTSADHDLAAEVGRRLPEGHEVRKHRHPYAWGIAATRMGRGCNRVAAILHELGVSGRKSEYKHVPDLYMRASPAQRLDLLRGLMDTDGYAHRHQAIFYSTSRALADAVVELTRSLGGIARVSLKRTESLPCWVVSLSLPTEIVPFLLERKRRCYRPRTKYLPARAIVSVEPIGTKSAQCIRIDDPNGLYVTNDYVVTHNTPQFLMAPPDGAPVLVVVPAALKSQTAERIVQWRGTSARVRILDGIGGFAAPQPGEWIVCNPELLPAAPSEVKGAERALAVAEDAALGELPLDAGQSIDAAAATRMLERLGKRGTVARGSFFPGTWLLVDEGHEYNSAKTAQTIRLRAIVRAVRAAGGKVVAATATPLLNDPGELRSLLATFGLGGVAWPAKTGRALDYWSYMRDWGGSKGAFGEEWQGEPRDAAIAVALRRVMLRRMFRDVVHVPAMLPTERIRVDLDEGLRAMADEADEMLRRRAGELDRGTKIVFETCSKVRAALAVTKLAAAHAWCDRQEGEREPAVVACVSRDVVKSIGKRTGWARIDGGESAERRAETVQRFQRGELRGVALTHAAGGVGIDLYRSARLLMISREWNPARNRQTLARLLRQGQTRQVGLSLLLADHAIEERLDALLAGRKRLMQAIDAAAVRTVAA